MHNTLTITPSGALPPFPPRRTSHTHHTQYTTPMHLTRTTRSDMIPALDTAPLLTTPLANTETGGGAFRGGRGAARSFFPPRRMGPPPSLRQVPRAPQVLLVLLLDAPPARGHRVRERLVADLGVEPEPVSGLGEGDDDAHVGYVPPAAHGSNTTEHNRRGGVTSAHVAAA